MWKPDISVVIPVYNEEKNLSILIPHIVDVLKPLDKKFEILLIDDGSTDKSLDIIKELCSKFMEVRYIKFIKNAGQSAAFDAGFRNALGETVVTLDADLQNDPNDIPKLLSFIPEYDVVCGWRAERNDSLIKKISSWVGNTIRNFMTNENIHDTGCSLKAYKNDWLKEIKLYRGMHRFLPTLLKMEGARVVEVKVNHNPRKFGKSKYNIRNRMFSGLYDLLAVRWMQKRKLNYEISERS
jgi:glycosyltransferase involved in cell wall biosynthesis